MIKWSGELYFNVPSIYVFALFEYSFKFLKVKFFARPKKFAFFRRASFWQSGRGIWVVCTSPGAIARMALATYFFFLRDTAATTFEVDHIPTGERKEIMDQFYTNTAAGCFVVPPHDEASSRA